MFNKKLKKHLKTNEVIAILITYFVLFSLSLSYSFKLEKKLEPKKIEFMNDYINSLNYKISDLFVFSTNNDRKEIVLGYVPYTKKYYDIETSTFCDISNSNIECLRKHLPNEYKYKYKLTISEIIEIENYINNQQILVRKLS